MGLLKITQNDETSFMYSNISVPDEILIILLRNNNTAFSAKLKTEDDVVKKWCRNLEKSSQEYMTLLHKAVETCSVSYSEDELSDKKEDVFEIQEDCLVWKQYFPDKKVYGRRGKFNLDKMSYEEAVQEALDGTIGDLSAKSNSIEKLTDDLDKKSKELHRAKDLTAKSVAEKEAFENAVYGKCVAIVNTKKLRIRQLMDGRPSPSGEQASAVRQILTSTQSDEQESKPCKSGHLDSGGYSSDTDVDDPGVDDVDTDEERSRRADTQRRKIYLKPKTQPARPVMDSQDDLFNNSLEAELYSTDRSNKKQKLTEDSSGTSRKKASNGKTATDVRKPGSRSSSRSARSDSQRSIIDELF